MKNSAKVSRVIIGITFLLLTACSTEQPEPEVVVIKEQIVKAIPAAAPEGVVRYCWEEPIVNCEKVGAGLDIKGHWYHPSHAAVRKVRQGRWRPCSPQQSKAETFKVR